ncbi:MAG: hypothetical protein CW342_13130 [Thermoactinomycetaceae bacterium]|nr:hypothetical protein [Thermoactinomycetaceae bacterium]
MSGERMGMGFQMVRGNIEYGVMDGIDPHDRLLSKQNRSTSCFPLFGSGQGRRSRAKFRLICF